MEKSLMTGNDLTQSSLFAPGHTLDCVSFLNKSSCFACYCPCISESLLQNIRTWMPSGGSHQTQGAVSTVMTI